MSVDDQTMDIRVKSVNSNLTLTKSHSYLYVKTDGGAVDITLPQGYGGSTSVGQTYIIKRNGPNNVNITHHSNDRIVVGTSMNNYSSPPYTLSNGNVIWVLYAGSFGDPAEGEWHIIAEFDGTIG